MKWICEKCGSENVDVCVCSSCGFEMSIPVSIPDSSNCTVKDDAENKSISRTDFIKDNDIEDNEKNQPDDADYISSTEKSDEETQASDLSIDEEKEIFENTSNSRKKNRKKKILIIGGIITASLLIIIAYALLHHRHVFNDPTCTLPAMCDCGEIDTQRPALGHEWGDTTIAIEATCVQKGMKKRICLRCGEEQNIELGMNPDNHKWGEDELLNEATCSHEGTARRTCILCGKIDTFDLPLKEHTWGEWLVDFPSSNTYKGRNYRKCKYCNAVDESRSPTLNMSQEDFENSCKPYDYLSVKLNPSMYSGTHWVIQGKVTQLIEENGVLTMMVALESSLGWDPYYTVLVIKAIPNSVNDIVEGNIVCIYGVCIGNETYETIVGTYNTIPSLLADYIYICRW